MASQTGGCLCGAVRFEAAEPPLRVTVCHCRFCQRATGGAYMVEPIFRAEAIRVTRGTPATYDHRSSGSGKVVHIHFCAACGTKLFLTFERFPVSCGVYAGTFDDPDWIEVRPDNAKHIFIAYGRPDTILPADTPLFADHAIELDGAPREPSRLEAPRAIGQHGTGRA